MAHRKGFLSRMFEKAAMPVLAAGILLGGGALVYEENVTTDMRVTVTGEHRALLHKGEGFGFTKKVFETDKGELTSTVNPWMGKFTRGDVEKQIEVGKTYDVKVQGFSFPIFGVYPNILTVKPVPPAPK